MASTTIIPAGGSNLLSSYPVGAIYQSASATSPASIMGGTWTEISDRFLYAVSTQESSKATSGSATVQLSTTHLPKMTGGSFSIWSSGQSSYTRGIVTATKGTNWQAGGSGTNNSWREVNFSLGSGTAHNNMPPYTTVYVWKRIA